MRKNQRILILSVALAGAVLASVASPALADPICDIQAWGQCAPPLGLQTHATSQNVVLTWGYDNNQPPPNEVDVNRAPIENGLPDYFAKVPMIQFTEGAPPTTWTDTTAKQGDQYAYEVCNDYPDEDFGTGVYQACMSSTIGRGTNQGGANQGGNNQPPPPECANPAPITDLASKVSDFSYLSYSPIENYSFSVQLTWTFPAQSQDCQLDSATIFRYRDSDQNPPEYQTAPFGVDTPGLSPWNDPGDSIANPNGAPPREPLRPDTTYVYAVCESYLNHSPVCSNTQIALPASPPSTPFNLHVSANSSPSPSITPKGPGKGVTQGQGPQSDLQNDSALPVYNLDVNWSSETCGGDVPSCGPAANYVVERQDLPAGQACGLAYKAPGCEEGWDEAGSVSGTTTHMLDEGGVPCTSSCTGPGPGAVKYRVCAIGGGWTNKTPAIDPSMFIRCSKPTTYVMYVSPNSQVLSPGTGQAPAPSNIPPIVPQGRSQPPQSRATTLVLPPITSTVPHR